MEKGMLSSSQMIIPTVKENAISQPDLTEMIIQLDVLSDIDFIIW
jgi:hypothetical protein